MKKRMLVAFAALLLAAGCGVNAEQPGSAINEENVQNDSNNEAVSPGEHEQRNENVSGQEDGRDGTGEDIGQGTTEEPSSIAASPQDAAAAVLIALSEQNTESLKPYIHPVKGLLFSPYGHIDTEKAQVFQASELPEMTDNTVYAWGDYDGSGEPIELTFADYFARFVYDKNYTEAETVGINEIKGQGNTLVNIDEVFPDSHTFDYYFSGFDEQYEGMDWRSLILVLEEHEGGWYISAIVHSEWTI